MKVPSALLIASLAVTEAFVPKTLSTTSSCGNLKLSIHDDADNEVTEPQSSLMGRRTLFNKSFGLVGGMALGSWFAATQPASARLESVNRPDLLPTEKGLAVIQVEKYLTSGQARRMNDLLLSLERDTGYGVKVLCQSYPNTPGLAIRDYWDLGKEVRTLWDKS